jgi:UDP-N-acetylglucosamine enolpyruvyl transferase
LYDEKALYDPLTPCAMIGLMRLIHTKFGDKPYSVMDRCAYASTLLNAGCRGDSAGSIALDGMRLSPTGDCLQVKFASKTDIDGSILTIADAPWPGFTPDLLSIVLVVCTQAHGDVLIHQKMFESRLFFVDKLIDMGAKIMLCDPHRAVVMGHNFQSQLKATSMSSPDIRAGISLLIAALTAKGTSTIQNIEQIDRGYERIDERLRAIGADIVRV